MPVKFNAAEGGYQAYVRSGGPGMTKFFSLKAYGEAEDARQAAERWARHTRKANPPVQRRGVRQANNTSGIAGVNFVWKTRNKPSGASSTAPYVTAAIGEERPCRGVLRHGVDGALMQAIKLRVDGGYPAPSAAEVIEAIDSLDTFVKAGPR